MASPRFRSRAVVVSLSAWWAAVVLGGGGWWLMGYGLTGPDLAVRIGTWGLGLAVLAVLVGWGASIGAVLHDVGRIRIGAWCLLALPLVSALFGWGAISSTMTDPSRPLGGLWLVVSGILLVVATSLIVAPAELGH